MDPKGRDEILAHERKHYAIEERFIQQTEGAYWDALSKITPKLFGENSGLACQFYWMFGLSKAIVERESRISDLRPDADRQHRELHYDEVIEFTRDRRNFWYYEGGTGMSYIDQARHSRNGPWYKKNAKTYYLLADPRLDADWFF